MILLSSRCVSDTTVQYLESAQNSANSATLIPTHSSLLRVATRREKFLRNWCWYQASTVKIRSAFTIDGVCQYGFGNGTTWCVLRFRKSNHMVSSILATKNLNYSIMIHEFVITRGLSSASVHPCSPLPYS